MIRVGPGRLGGETGGSTASPNGWPRSAGPPSGRELPRHPLRHRRGRLRGRLASLGRRGAGREPGRRHRAPGRARGGRGRPALIGLIGAWSAICSTSHASTAGERSSPRPDRPNGGRVHGRDQSQPARGDRPGDDGHHRRPRDRGGRARPPAVADALYPAGVPEPEGTDPPRDQAEPPRAEHRPDRPATGVDGEVVVWEARYSKRNFIGRIVVRVLLDDRLDRPGRLHLGDGPRDLGRS